MLIKTPDKGLMIFHFATQDDAKGTLANYRWAEGCEAVVFGGNEESVSRWLLTHTISYLKANEIKTYGVSSASKLWVGSDGKYYTTK
ncbi:MAG: hypothetical protein ACRC7O_05585 [Fimbriiglobus sp.]